VKKFAMAFIKYYGFGVSLVFARTKQRVSFLFMPHMKAIALVK